MHCVEAVLGGVGEVGRPTLLTMSGRPGLRPGIPIASAIRGMAKAQQTEHSEIWDCRVLLLLHGRKRFVASDLGPPTFKLVEALHRLVDCNYVERIALPACRWCYEETPNGWAQAERVLAGHRFVRPEWIWKRMDRRREQ